MNKLRAPTRPAKATFAYTLSGETHEFKAIDGKMYADGAEITKQERARLIDAIHLVGVEADLQRAAIRRAEQFETEERSESQRRK